MSKEQPSGQSLEQAVAGEVMRTAGALGSRVSGVVALAALVLAFVAFRAWLEERDDRMRMEATLASQGSIMAAAQKREQGRGQELADTLKQIAELKRTVETPQQVIREIPQFLPQLPQPIVPIVPTGPPGPAASSGGTAPGVPAKAGEAASPDVRVPAADLKPLFNLVQDCRACQASLSSAQQDLKDERAKSAALTKERDAAVKAAKGGGAWQRTVRAAKWLAVGFAVGYVVHATAR